MARLFLWRYFRELTWLRRSAHLNKAGFRHLLLVSQSSLPSAEPSTFQNFARYELRFLTAVQRSVRLRTCTVLAIVYTMVVKTSLGLSMTVLGIGLIVGLLLSIPVLTRKAI